MPRAGKPKRNRDGVIKPSKPKQKVVETPVHVEPLAVTAGMVEAKKPNWVVANPILYQKFKPAQKRFLKAYAQTMMIKRAAAAAHVSVHSHYEWMHTDQNYRAAFESTKDMAVDLLEDAAAERAIHGVDEPVFFKDQLVGSKTNYSDTLAIFLLKANRPEKYRENQRIEHVGKDGGPITIAKLDELLQD